MTVRIDETSIGKYICRASVKGFREISASAEVFMKGPPRILNTEAIFYGRVGSNVELSCDAFAVPPPSTIQWSNYGFSVPINQASDHFRYLFQGFMISNAFGLGPIHVALRSTEKISLKMAGFTMLKY